MTTPSTPTPVAVAIPNWVTYPEEDWEPISPENAGLDVPAWHAWIAQRRRHAGPHSVAGSNTEGRYGVVITRGGRRLAEIGDGGALFNSASVAKAFSSIALQLAIEDGLIRSEHDRVCQYWTGTEGPKSEQLDSPHKYMTEGHNAAVTFHHLWTMQAGFPGYYYGIWRNDMAQREAATPPWENWPASPPAQDDWSFITKSTWSHIPPGQATRYSSAGMWRLSQALTYIVGRELKDYLDDRLFSEIGILPGEWTWLTGREIHENFNFYPEIPGYGKFIDPPYELKGKRVQGGGGWAVMSPNDLARVGLLVATRGIWKGKRLIQDTPHLCGHSGYGQSRMAGWGRFEDVDLYVSLGVVAACDTLSAKATAAEFRAFIQGPVRPRSEARDL